MDAIDLEANLRDKVGKGSARFARKNNLIPAVIYGNKEKPIPISLEKKEVAQQMVYILTQENCQYELDDVALVVLKSLNFGTLVIFFFIGV